MTQISWPFDNADTTEAQYSEMFKRLMTDGVWADSVSTALLPYGDSSGMSVKVRAGYAFVRGHFYNNDATLTQAIEAATSQPRVDTIILRLNPTVNSIVIAVLKGTAAVAPVPAALTQTATGIFELPLAYVNVAASASTIAAANVTDQRRFAGVPFGKWTTATRPTAPRRGDAGYNFTTSKPEFWDGTSWVPFAPSSFTASQISDQENINAGKISGRRITVSNTGAPSSPSVGDVFIDWS